MGYLSDSYRDLNPMKTDMYQLTMAQGYFDQGRQDEEVSFYMHWRNPPFGGGYTMAAGLEGVVDFLKNFKFDQEHITYLSTLEKGGKRLFSDEFLHYLATTELKLDVDAVPEGTVMTGQGPVIRVTGPLAQAQLVESAILNIVNSSSIVATRAARLTDVANGRPVADFSLRRAGTLDTAVARSSTIGGIGAVADIDAARRLGITPTGTMAHAWIMGFKAAIEGYTEAKKNGTRWISPYYQSTDREFYENLVRQAVDAVFPNVTSNEIEVVAFKAYLKSMPTNSVLLIDTFDPIQGVKNAIRAAIEMNVPLEGVRLDSGDIYKLGFETKALLNEAKATHPEIFGKSRIFATDGLDEARIQAHQAKAKEDGKEFPIDVYGVGTELGNPGPLRGGVYKVCANEIIREDFETHLEKDGTAKTIIVGGETIPVSHGMVGTMKIAGIDPLNPTLPSSKSSMPGYQLNTLRLKDKDGNQISDIIIDESLRKGTDWKELLKDGIVDAAGKKVDLGEVHDAETLLKPVFKRQAEGPSSYVYDAPPEKPAYKGGPMVTDLHLIQQYGVQQRTSLRPSIRAVVDPELQPILMDPRVCQQRQAIMIEATKPGVSTSGNLDASQGQQKAI